jgi:hypothetical protein
MTNLPSDPASLRARIRHYRHEVALAMALTVCAAGFIAVAGF